MSTQKYDRFKAAPWFQEGIRPATLVGGAGGIGSWLTLLLNRAGFETYVFDFDRLEELNMAGQLFMHKSIGKQKVDALADLVRELCRDEIIPNNEMMDKTTMTNDIVFSAFDNMKARREIFETWRETNKGSKTAIFIDGRLTMEQLTIFCVRADHPEELEEYDKVHLFDDSKVPDMDCTAKQTSHGAAMIAANMVAKFTNWYSGIVDAEEERSTVFFWQHYIPANYTFQRAANAIQEAQVAMAEDKPVEMSANVAAFEESQEMLADRPGVGGETFTLTIPEDWTIEPAFTATEVMTVDQARLHAELLGLGDEFETMVTSHRRNTGEWPTQVEWRVETIQPNPQPDSLVFEDEGEEEEMFDDPDEEDEELDETPDPEPTGNITIDMSQINMTTHISTATLTDGTNRNLIWLDAEGRVVDPSQMVVGIDPYRPDETT